MDSSFGEFDAFLRKRRIDETSIQRMHDDKVDATVIALMTEEELKSYLPRYGDRIAVKTFVKTLQNPESSQPESESPQKKSLIERLTMRMKHRNQHEYETRSKSQLGNKNAKKSSRRVEIGWIDFDSQNNIYKQVKEPCGGGTRHSIYDTFTTLDILPDAKECFFPSGKNRRGLSTDFDLFLTDSTHDVIDEETSVDEMYRKKRCKILRLYLASGHRTLNVTNDASSELNVSTNDSQTEQVGPSTCIVENAGLSSDINMNAVDSGYISNSDELPDLETIIDNGSTVASICDSFWLSSSHSPEQINVPLPSLHSPTPSVDSTVLLLHRTKIQEEMVAVFMDPDIVDTTLKVKFIDEEGSDAEGITRDAYSAFWKEFFATSACGEEERVPMIFPNYGKREWEAVGRILQKGYIDASVFPLQLSYAFSVAIICGEAAVTPDILMQSLKAYLSKTDWQVLDKALMNEYLSEEDKDDFLDLLSRVDCHSIPDSQSVKHEVLNIAHKELIQEPKYALDAIASTSRNCLSQWLSTPTAIQIMYENKTPTARKVIKLLESNPVSKEQSTVFSYLKQFIKGLDDLMLKKCLRYVTGAEIICVSSIEVTFNKMRGLGRSPIAHTCGPLLELPSTYSSFPEFRNEFLSLLDANYLSMDIV